MPWQLVVGGGGVCRWSVVIEIEKKKGREEKKKKKKIEKGSDSEIE